MTVKLRIGSPRFRLPPRIMWRVLLVAFASGQLVAAYWTIRMSYADYRSSLGSSSDLAAAAALVPGNAEYRSRLSADADGDDSAIAALRAAVGANPRLAAAWIDLGLRLEASGDLGRARQSLLAGAGVDKTFIPAWTLANFHFRHAETGPFWRWAGRAASVSYQPLDPVFRLCWLVRPDPPVILAKVVPDRCDALRQYAAFLFSMERSEEGGEVAVHAAVRATKQDTRNVLGLCDRLLDRGYVAAAVRTWNALARRRVLPYAEVAGRRREALTNGDFARPAVEQGFDWRITRAPGVFVHRVGAQRGLQIVLSGHQPASCRIIEQYVPLRPEWKGSFGVRWRSTNVPQDGGIAFTISDARTNAELARICGPPSDQSWHDNQLQITAPRGTQLVRVALQCERIRGRPRADGSLWVDSITLHRSD